jgi:hypothetical protein
MKKGLFLLFLISLLAGCAAPSPLVKLTPSTIANEDYWSLGQQFVFTNEKNIWFDCAFNRFENGNLIFDVKITNETDTAILVDPNLFVQRVFKNDSFRIAQNFASDPELILYQLSKDEKVAASNAKKAAAFGICSAIISMGAAVVVAASDMDYDIKDNILNSIVATNDIAQISSGLMAESSNIRAEENWTMNKNLSEILLRKTTVPKGYYVDGQIQFPYYDKAKWYEISMQAGNSKGEFLFRQYLEYPSVDNNSQ